ncbi:hypothetical protein HER39_11455, partial [Arthrobacter deserti]|nr:hypothetical protein [Arthrobacter deserti]
GSATYRSPGSTPRESMDSPVTARPQSTRAAPAARIPGRPRRRGTASGTPSATGRTTSGRKGGADRRDGLDEGKDFSGFIYVRYSCCFRRRVYSSGSFTGLLVDGGTL